MSNSKDIEQQIESIVSSAMVKVTFSYVGETNEDNWKCDAWRVTFEQQFRNNPAKPYISESFDYYTGMGHRKEDTIAASALLRQGYKRHLHAHKFYAVTKPQSPHMASVLQCLILDSSACDESFDDWCSNFGYDTDSRKALETYLACQEGFAKLKKVFPMAVINQLRDVLTEY